MKSRIEELDTIRGYAIFGILVCNIFYFHHPLEYFHQFFLSNKSASNEVFNFIRFNYFAERTYTIFSLLFGIGIGMQFQNFNKQNHSFLKQHSIRMFILFLLGILHTFFFWYGDVLTLYALLGFCIIPLLNKGFKTLLSISIILYLIPTIYVILSRNGIYEINFGKTQSISLDESINQNTSQGILGHLKYNFGQIKLVYEYYATGVMFSSLAMITLGFSIAKTKVFYKKVIDTKTHKKVLMFCIPLIILWSLYKLFIFKHEEMDNPFNFYIFWFLSNTSAIAQTFFVFSGFFLFYNSKLSNSIILKGFNKMGKLSLTNYISHSLFGLLVYKVLGFFGQSNPTFDFLLSIGLTIVQIIISHCILVKYGKGPLENIWRKLTKLLLNEKQHTTHR